MVWIWILGDIIWEKKENDYAWNEWRNWEANCSRKKRIEKRREEKGRREEKEYAWRIVGNWNSWEKFIWLNTKTKWEKQKQ